MRILDGMKIITCKLKPNELGFTSISYPTDELRLPLWFTSLPFDDEAMEYTLVDKKIDNLLSVLEWDLHKETVVNNVHFELFRFE
jgi:hypothetical protein